MTDTNTAEREAATDGKWYMVNKDGMATLCADEADAEREAADAQAIWPGMGPHRAVQLVEAGRASLAANAGSEPVAHLWQHSETGRTRVVMLDAVTDADASWLLVGPLCLGTHPSPPEGMAGWISVEDRLPEWAARDDTPCFINGKEVPPTLTSETVLVALQGGGVRTDKLTTIEGKSAGWWHTYGERVIAWQKPPAPPLPASEAKEAGQ